MSSSRLRARWQAEVWTDENKRESMDRTMARRGRNDQETLAGDSLLESERSPWSAGTVIAGRYRLDRLIGEGGMGTVWAATHSITRRSVALKFLTDERSPRVRKRFLREARAAAAVSHPSVIDIYDVLELEDGAPVIVMELLPGESLASRLEPDKRLPLRQAASILLQVAEAVGAAHAQGIIHRDLKPENIFLLDGPDGRVKVLDFGIAKLTALDGPAAKTMALTDTGSLLGTPCYMAPEQTEDGREIDHRADIWALGLILYRCLSGVLPTDGDNIIRILMLIVAGTIPKLATHAPEIPAEVSALVDRMLSRQRDDRPADLRQVAEILARHAGKAVPSIPPPRRPEKKNAPSGPPIELQRVSHLAPPPTFGPAAVPCLPVDPLAKTEDAADPLTETEKPAPLKGTADMAVTRVLEPPLGDGRTRELSSAPPRPSASQPPEPVEPMVAESSPCFAVAFRPDGALLATAHDSGVVYLWETATGTAVRAFLGHMGCVYSLAFRPDGAHLVTGSADATVRVWHVATGRCVFVFEGHLNAVRSVAITPDGQTIVSADGQSVLLWPLTGGPASRVIKDPKALLRSVAISPDGRTIATGAPHGVISLWEAATGELIAEWRTIRAPLRALAFHPSGQILASCGDNVVRLWGVDSGHVLHVLSGHEAPVRSLAFCPDGETIVSGSDDRTLRRWETATGRLVRVLEGHGSAVHGVAFRADGRMLASGDDDRGLTLWDLPEGRARRIVGV